jgi:hypothetical protein
MGEQSWGRYRLLGTAFLLAAALLGLSRLADAADPKNPPKNPAKKDKGKPVVFKPLGPMTLKMKIARKDSDIAEMAKLIDEKLEAGWKANKITHSHFVSDHEFIRRASLDIIGRIAKPEEIKKFLSDPAETRRSLLIDRLLAHEDYARHWANMWSNWLLTRAGNFGRGKYHDQMSLWLEDQFANNKPYDQIVTKLITAKGKNSENGSVNFVLAHVGEANPAARVKEEGAFEMVPLTSRIARTFLGIQIQCAQCHPHPFSNDLKQEMFWGINAFLRQVKPEGMPRRRMRGMAPPDLTLSDNPGVNEDANVFFELRNGKVKMWRAEFLPASAKERGDRLDPKKTKGIERREELAKYLTKHPMFAKAIVNRMWGLFYGRGFVNPIDDFNDNNLPSNPELLDELASRFKHYNYDLHKLIRWMTHAKAYHLSYVANPTNDKAEHEALFSRMIMKSLTPEQLFESLVTATMAEQTKNAKDKKELRDKWLGGLITNFGDDEGNEINFNGTIVQALMMMNGKEINDAISSEKTGGVTRAMVGSKTPTQAITKMYLIALNREPSKGELKGVMAKMPLRRGYKDSVRAQYEDLFWALLNSNEFLLNH